MGHRRPCRHPDRLDHRPAHFRIELKEPDDHDDEQLDHDDDEAAPDHDAPADHDDHGAADHHDDGADDHDDHGPADHHDNGADDHHHHNNAVGDPSFGVVPPIGQLGPTRVGQQRMGIKCHEVFGHLEADPPQARRPTTART